MSRALCVFAFAALALASCDKKDGSTTSGSAAAPSDSDLAVPADFADEAEKSITKDTYKGELDSLEKEIDADAK